MRAAQAVKFGGPEVLVTTELPDPAPGPGEVLIDVAYVDTIFLETQLRAGWGQEYFPVEPPFTPGSGVAGTVCEVGDGVDPSWIGRHVTTSYATGSYAELTTAPADGLVPLSDDLAPRTAAALIHDGITGTGLTELTAIAPGERVLILGASGGMGTLLVQLAHARGAHVVAVARGERKLALVRELGADVAVDGARPDWQERAREALGTGGADVVLDGVGGQLGLTAFELTAAGGRFSAHGAPSGGFAPIAPAEAERRGITLLGIADVQFTPEDRRRLTLHIFEEAAAGRLRPVIGGVFPLDRAAEAHAAIEGRTLLGKVLLET
jgi:NADPH2:quinone reductase